MTETPRIGICVVCFRLMDSGDAIARVKVLCPEHDTAANRKLIAEIFG